MVLTIVVLIIFFLGLELVVWFIDLLVSLDPQLNLITGYLFCLPWIDYSVQSIWLQISWTTFGRSPLRDKVLHVGQNSRPHLVKVCCVTKSSNEGQYLDQHIWSKSAVQQSPPMRGNHWTTFGQSPLCDKVLRQGAIIGPHLVKVRCVTKSSDEGQSLDHIWLESAVRQSPPTRGKFFFRPHLVDIRCVIYFLVTFLGSCPLHDNFFWPHLVTKVIFIDNELLTFWGCAQTLYSMSNTATMSYMMSMPKRPDLTGKPDQVFQFKNFMDHLMGCIRAGTITALGTLVPGSLSLQYLHASQPHATCSEDRWPSLETAQTNRASSLWLRSTWLLSHFSSLQGQDKNGCRPQSWRRYPFGLSCTYGLVILPGPLRYHWNSHSQLLHRLFRTWSPPW